MFEVLMFDISLGDPWDGGPLRINPICTLFSGYLLGISPLNITNLVNLSYQMIQSDLFIPLLSTTTLEAVTFAASQKGHKKIARYRESHELT